VGSHHTRLGVVISRGGFAHSIKDYPPPGIHGFSEFFGAMKEKWFYEVDLFANGLEYG